MLQNDIALDKQIRMIVSTHFGNVSEVGKRYNIRCNVCGDSKKSKYKKRGYILKDKKPWVYYCHNCFYKAPVTVWMKEFFPLNFKEYIKDSVMLNNNIIIEDENPIEEVKEEEYVESDNVKFFIPILKGNGKLFDIAKQVCIKRRIPESVWNTWFVATNGKYKKRLIIPFYNNEGKIYYYQGRALYDYLIPKYLSRYGIEYNSVYNYYNVDKSKPVYILEGCIDSIFVENSIALTGLKIEDKMLNDFPFRYFILDDDESGRDRSIELLKKGEYVFNWFAFKKDHGIPKREKWDINEVYLFMNRTEIFKSEELKKYFTNSIMNKGFFV